MARRGASCSTSGAARRGSRVRSWTCATSARRRRWTRWATWASGGCAHWASTAGRSTPPSSGPSPSATRLANGQPSFSRQIRRLREIAQSARHGGQPAGGTAAHLHRRRREPAAGRRGARAHDPPVRQPPRRDHLTARVPAPCRRTRATGRAPPSPSAASTSLRCAAYQGRALYLDADMQVFGDIAELWDIDFDGAKILCTNQPEETTPEQWRGSSHFHPGRQMSVMMLDCASAALEGPRGRRGASTRAATPTSSSCSRCAWWRRRRSGTTCPRCGTTSSTTNPGVTRLLHYTVVPTQPWKNDANPLRAALGGGVRRGVDRARTRAGAARIGRSVSGTSSGACAAWPGLCRSRRRSRPRAVSRPSCGRLGDGCRRRSGPSATGSSASQRLCGPASADRAVRRTAGNPSLRDSGSVC